MLKMGSIYLEGEAFGLQVLCQQVQHAHHLREDEDPVARLLEAHQQLVQQNQLTTALDQRLPTGEREKYYAKSKHSTQIIDSFRPRKKYCLFPVTVRKKLQ